jgi:hypothetical protein
MRKIISRETKDNKNKRNQVIVGVFLIGIMLFGTLGYAFGGREEENSKKIEYSGIEFVQDDSGYWRFNIQGNELVTVYNPEETEEIGFFIYSSINDYVNEPLYFVSEFQEPIFELGRDLNPFVLRIGEACLSEDCERDFPVKNCSVDNIIIIEEPLDGEGANIYQEENCIFIIANSTEQIKYSDAFLFKILGI